VEEELARQAAQGLAAKEAEVNRVAALTDKVRNFSTAQYMRGAGKENLRVNSIDNISHISCSVV
jgi:hypothetical protein